MYCSTCGVAVTNGLTYCNYCGAKLGATGGESGDQSPEVRPGLLVSAISALFIFGMVAIIMLMGMMKAVMQIPVERVLALSLLPFLLLLVIEGIFIRLLLRSKRGAEQANSSIQLKGQATKELDTGPVRDLPEHMPSVTEHTTRTFEPIPRDRAK